MTRLAIRVFGHEVLALEFGPADAPLETTPMPIVERGPAGPVTDRRSPPALGFAAAASPLPRRPLIR